MKTSLASATLLLLALGLAACAARGAGSAPAPTRRESTPEATGLEPAGRPLEGATGLEGATKSMDAPTPVQPGVEREAPLARDLGDGAGGEKLGGFQRSHRAVPRPAVQWPFTDVDQPECDTSTFALSVHTGSASLVRQALLDRNRWPDPHQVRTEELINAFTYADPHPTREDGPLRITTETVQCPWNRANQIVRIAITSRELTQSQRPPANLVFLIDVSGSMSEEERLPLLKRGLRLLTQQLGPDDRVAIVTYAANARIVLPPTPGDRTREILAAIDALKTGGGTNGSAGISEAYRVARQECRHDRATRVILASDGDFNAGMTDDRALASLVEGEVRAGIHLTVLGVGMGTRQDRRLETLADRGDGFYAYLDSDDEARRLFLEQLPASLITLAEDAKVQVFFNPTVIRGWRLLGYQQRQLNRRDFSNDRIEGGEIGAGHAVTALYEVIPTWVPSDPDRNPFSDRAEAEVRGFPGGTALRVRLRWQPPGGGASSLLEQDVDAIERAPAPRGDAAWCLALTGFAHLLRNDYWYDSTRPTWREVLDLAEAGVNGADRAARREFIRAMETARQLAQRR